MYEIHFYVFICITLEKNEYVFCMWYLTYLLILLENAEREGWFQQSHVQQMDPSG